MSDELRKLQCLVDQIVAERQTIKSLEGLNLSEGRKEQIINERLGEVRRGYGSEMCMDNTAWLNREK